MFTDVYNTSVNDDELDKQVEMDISEMSKMTKMRIARNDKKKEKKKKERERSNCKEKYDNTFQTDTITTIM